MSFDRIAKHYAWMEALLAGGALQRCRTTFLDRTSKVERALLLGEGHGRFLVPFLRVNMAAQVTCVEQSAEMILQARRRLAQHELDPARVNFINQDALDWEFPPEKFDLIVTHFFLDCFTPDQLESLVPRIASSARPGCLWLLADFQIPEAGVLRRRAKLIHKLMYAFFRIATALPARRLTSPDPFLTGANFRREARQVAQFGLLHSDCWVR